MAVGLPGRPGPLGSTMASAGDPLLAVVHEYARQCGALSLAQGVPNEEDFDFLVRELADGFPDWPSERQGMELRVHVSLAAELVRRQRLARPLVVASVREQESFLDLLLALVPRDGEARWLVHARAELAIWLGSTPVDSVRWRVLRVYLRALGASVTDSDAPRICSSLLDVAFDMNEWLSQLGELTIPTTVVANCHVRPPCGQVGATGWLVAALTRRTAGRHGATA